MAKSIRKTPSNDAAKSLRETEKRIRAISKQIEKTGRLRNPKTGAFIKVSGPNIKKVEREILRDVKQSKRTLKAASKFVDTIKGFFKDKQKGAVKSSPKTKSKSSAKKPPSKGSSKISGTAVTRPSKSPSKVKISESATKPTKSRRKSPTDNNRQRIYEVSELPEAFKGDTALETFELMRENADAYNQLLRPGDVFGAQIGYTNENGHFVGGYTHNVFPDIESILAHLENGTSGGSNWGDRYSFRKHLRDVDDKDTVLDLIKIIRFRSPQKGLTKLRPDTMFNANSVMWQQKILSFNAKKAESKKAFKKKMQKQDKERETKRAKREKKLVIGAARLRGQISALEIENKRLRAERDNRK